jgi:hypothetical protein
MSNGFFSIITKSYWAHLQTTAASIARFHPDFKYNVLIIDDVYGFADFTKDSRFSFFRPEDFISHQLLLKLYKENSPFELSCIFKAKFAQYLFTKKNFEKLVYLDVDLFFYQPITPFLNDLEQFNIIITPHLLTPKANPAKEGIWLEAFQIGTGLYNMGFFGLRKSAETLSFLSWWDERTSFRCRRDLGHGMFDDQSWIDPVPIIFDSVKVFKDPGYNVANWNLYERNLVKKNNSFFVDDIPLTFFHFSQANVLQETHLTNYRDLLLKSNSALEQLFLLYKEALLQNKFEEVSLWKFHKSFTIGTL